MIKTIRKAYLEAMSLSGIKGVEGMEIWIQGALYDLSKLVAKYGGNRIRDS